MGVCDAPSASTRAMAEESAFDPAKIPGLEARVGEQTASGMYDLDNNVGLLRMYAMYPDKLSEPMAANIMVKALMALPAADFRLCAGLLPARVMRQEPFSTLATLSAMLEQADFGAFWKKVSEVKEGEVAGMLGEGWSIEGSTVKVPPSSSNTAHATGAVRVTLSTDSITRIIAAQ